MLKERGYTVGGIICPEIRKDGVRQGFEIVDLLGRRGTLAHVSLYSPAVPTISRYGVNTRDLDAISREALERRAEAFIVDEIGPMELRSRVFVSGVQRVLDSAAPVAAAVHYRAGGEFVSSVRMRPDATTTLVTPGNRDRLPGLICDAVIRVILARPRR